MLRQARLDEQGSLLRIQANGQPVGDHLADVVLQIVRLRVVRSQHVPVSYEVVTLILVLQLHPVLQRAHQVAQVELSCWAHAAQNPPPRPGIR